MNKKTSRRSVTRVTKYCKNQQICTTWNSSVDPPDPPDQVSGAAARNQPSTRAGGQDDVSYFKLPQINKTQRNARNRNTLAGRVTPSHTQKHCIHGTGNRTEVKLKGIAHLCIGHVITGQNGLVIKTAILAAVKLRASNAQGAYMFNLH